MEKRNQVNFCLSEEEKNILTHRCKERGIGISPLLRELIRESSTYTELHSIKVKNALHMISAACTDLEDEYSEDNIKKLKKGVTVLWRSLQ